MIYFIYCLKQNDEIKYVGSTTRSLHIRFKEHIRRKKLIESEYCIELIEAVSGKDSAKQKEEFYIRKYNLVEEGMNKTYGYGTQGLGTNDTSFRKGNELGKLGTKAVLCIELNKKYESITQCAKDLELSISKISAVCRGKRKTTGGYHFEFIEYNQERL